MSQTPHPQFKWKEALAARFIYGVIRLLWSTYRVSHSGGEYREAAEAQHPKRVTALSCWHEHILGTTAFHRGQRLTVMTSRSKDGRIAGYTLHQYGFHVTYGSSSRGGRSALHEMIDAVNDGWSGAIAVDGPRGPRHQVKAGIVQIARRCQCAMIPVSYAADRAWRLKSWDRFVIPKPFARVHLVYGAPIPPPPEDADERTFQLAQQTLAAALAKAEQDAINALDLRARSQNRN